MVDLDAVRSRQRAVWETSDYAVVGTTMQIVAESLCEAIDVRSGSLVLDVAAGNGNATLAAARRWCDVVSTDVVTTLLDSGRRRAQAEGHVVTFERADAERLPFLNNWFDAVLSTFGVIFAADQERAAQEIVRVCKPGGRIGLANWTPDGFMGQLIEMLGRYVPSATGIGSPASWGTRQRLDELFRSSAADIRAERRQFVFRYRSPLHWVEVFRTYYGPVSATFAALEADGQAALTRDLVDLLQQANRSRDRSLIVPSEYLEVAIDVA